MARSIEGGEPLSPRERRAGIARSFGRSRRDRRKILSLDEHFNGKGHPRGLRGHEIPLLARIAGLAQTVEVFAADHGVAAALEVAQARRGRWFDPELVDALVDEIGKLLRWA